MSEKSENNRVFSANTVDDDDKCHIRWSQDPAEVHTGLTQELEDLQISTSSAYPRGDGHMGSAPNVSWEVELTYDQSIKQEEIKSWSSLAADPRTWRSQDKQPLPGAFSVKKDWKKTL